jgi:hypothetical protein
MGRFTKVNYTWRDATEHLDHLAKVNARADEAWLRSLTMDQSVLIFEDLSRGIPEVRATSELDPPPVVLLRIWRP